MNNTPAPAAAPPPVFGPEYYDFLAPADRPGDLGRLGTYRVLSIVGAGGMGVVYEAEDIELERRVALKAMLPALAANPSARQRFLREAKAAAAVEHERIVPIFQVDEDRGIPFLVMPLLRGETLENRLGRSGKLSVSEALRIGREIAEALAAAHGCGLIHRDIKPANVWLEGTKSTVKLLDFGLARAAETTAAPLSMSGSLYGTAGYVAPEQAQGENVDYRADLFALGCVLYRMCSGTLPFPGSSALAILIAVVNQMPPPPVEAAPEVPTALSQLIMQLLAKQPAGRPQSAQVVIEILGGIPVPSEPPRMMGPPTSSLTPPDADVLLSATARTPKFSGSAFANDQGFAFPPDEGLQPCAAAQATQIAPDNSPSTARLPVRETAKMPEVPDTPSPQGKPTGPGGEFPPPARAKTGSRKILLGAIGATALIALAAVLLPRFWQAGPVPLVEINIACGSEKENWFKEAKADFAAAPEGTGIQINLIQVGSVKAGQRLTSDKGERIHAWSPAHGIYKAKFVQEWQARHPGQNPILKEEALCMTPMVIVFWKERYDAFLAKYKTVSFENLSAAMNATNGWGDIAGKPDWGRFRFGMAQPGKSNSALMGVALLACELNKSRTLTPADLARAEIRSGMSSFKQGLAENAQSTDKLIQDMVGKGPTALDAVLIYENLAIDYLKAARGRWGDLHVAYPRSNIFNDNPYYILDVPWSSPEQRRAAEAFLNFLLSAPMQQKALSHGFRPANIAIPYRDDANSPFVRQARNGLTVSINSICEVNQAAVLDGLLSAWGTVP